MRTAAALDPPFKEERAAPRRVTRGMPCETTNENGCAARSTITMTTSFCKGEMLMQDSVSVGLKINLYALIPTELGTRRV